MFDQTPKQPTGGQAAPVAAPPSPPVVPPAPAPPAVLPAPASQSAEDLFAMTDPSVPSQHASSGAPPPPPTPGASGESRGIKFWAILGGAVFLVLIIGGIWLTVRSSNPSPKTEKAMMQDDVMTGDNAHAENVSRDQFDLDEELSGSTPTEVVPEVDTDRDGLSDSDEAVFGTDPQNADTDGDGLSDSAEIRTYKTNPLNPDSDQDTFLDGAEVRAGYDPNGSGRLDDVNRALDNRE